MTPIDDAGNAANPYAAPTAVASEPDQVLDNEEWGGEFHPFKTIWLHPRRTVRRIVSEDPTLYVIPLVCLAGITESLDRATMRNAGDAAPFLAVVAAAFVFGPLGGLLSLWIGSHLIRIAGDMIGGVAPRAFIRTAIAWASVPSVVALALWVPQLVLFGPDMFTQATPRIDSQPVLASLLIVIAVIEMILGIWGFILLCNTVAEVQGFRSAWAGFGNLLLAGAVLFIPLLIVLIVVVMWINVA